MCPIDHLVSLSFGPSVAFRFRKACSTGNNTLNANGGNWNFGQSNRRWVQGDNDYNLTINLVDFNRLAGNFGLSGLGPDCMLRTKTSTPFSVSALPDPLEDVT